MGMQFIPAGMFLMGDTMSDNIRSQPVHGVQVSAFCMDRTEVTVAAWRSCTSPSCLPPNTGGTCNWGAVERDNHPINCVDWVQARTYCQLRGGDLPTEAQWEYAARGTDRRLYPWGSTPAPSAQVCWSGVRFSGGTCPVGSFSAGNSPFGLFDMAGNVREWTIDWYGAYTGSTDSYVLDPTGPVAGSRRVNRGGAWNSSVNIFLFSPRRDDNSPAGRSDLVGFRCARAALN